MMQLGGSCQRVQALNSHTLLVSGSVRFLIIFPPEKTHSNEIECADEPYKVTFISRMTSEKCANTSNSYRQPAKWHDGNNFVAVLCQKNNIFLNVK